MHALNVSLLPLSNMLHPAVCEALSSADVLASSSRSQQCRASTTFLLVLACRGVLSLHEAVACIRGAAESGLSPEATAAPMRTAGDAAVHFYLVSTLQVLSNMLATLHVSQMGQPAAPAASSSSAAPRTAEDVQATTNDRSCSRPVRWQHLLQLRASRKLTDALLDFREKWTWR
jgi:hypothetical protein